MQQKLKVFVIYYKEAPIYASDIFEPIQAGCDVSTFDLGFLKDNTGENISYKNPNYGEMTAWYWVWKNYLPQHPELEYVGFCHYRRFFKFDETYPLEEDEGQVLHEDFAKYFYDEYMHLPIYDIVKPYDMLLPASFNTEKRTIYKHYAWAHEEKDLVCAIEIIKEHYPEYLDDMNLFFNNNTMRIALNFIMKKEPFNEFMSWAFDILSKLGQVSDWSEYTSYTTIRTPAFLMERLMNVWLNYQIRVNKINILEKERYLVVDKVYYKKRCAYSEHISLITDGEYKILKFFGLQIPYKRTKRIPKRESQ